MYGILHFTAILAAVESRSNALAELRVVVDIEEGQITVCNAPQHFQAFELSVCKINLRMCLAYL